MRVVVVAVVILTVMASRASWRSRVTVPFDACGAALHRLRSAVRKLSPSAA